MSPGERLVRGGLAAALVSPACGAVATQYVDSAYPLLVPALTAAVVAEAVLRAAGRPVGEARLLLESLRVLAVVGAVVATAAALSFGPGHTSLVAPVAQVLPAYVVAAGTAAVRTHPSSAAAGTRRQALPTWRRSGSAAEQDGPTT